MVDSIRPVVPRTQSVNNRDRCPVSSRLWYLIRVDNFPGNRSEASRCWAVCGQANRWHTAGRGRITSLIRDNPGSSQCRTNFHAPSFPPMSKQQYRYCTTKLHTKQVVYPFCEVGCCFSANLGLNVRIDYLTSSPATGTFEHITPNWVCLLLAGMRGRTLLPIIRVTRKKCQPRQADWLINWRSGLILVRWGDVYGWQMRVAVMEKKRIGWRNLALSSSSSLRLQRSEEVFSFCIYKSLPGRGWTGNLAMESGHIEKGHFDAQEKS